ncbi:oxygen-dependent coproporphyrinogen oxidase [Sunxiuqinia sp. sy24]|uniref:oxygen-dependent coproporphyrinogen oxidase n=1 Tax=Sunxiuqinia sp. sy24 TaxID=3461495 RepID=UPI00404661EE
MRNDQVASIYRKIQQQICTELETADGHAVFKTDHWENEIGYGYTMVLDQGDAIEKAAVNFSAVRGKVSERMRKALRIDEGEAYFATGISSIIHPRNPHAPITHMNVRYFQLSSGKAWFGGGIDLTPHYVNKQQARWFHQELKNLCDQYDADFYPNYKQWADTYFYLQHRKETRGVGGIFFDHQDGSSDAGFQKFYAFTQALAKAYPRIYTELLTLNRDKECTKEEKRWQDLRRGRYVEFNLLYDRGTKFGLESNGRTESIFLSMPPMASWTYDFQAEKGSPEEATLNLLKKDIDWIHIT